MVASSRCLSEDNYKEGSRGKQEEKALDRKGGTAKGEQRQAYTFHILSGRVLYLIGGGTGVSQSELQIGLGDEVSRYLRLNPVRTRVMKRASVSERRGVLRAYLWSRIEEQLKMLSKECEMRRSDTCIALVASRVRPILSAWTTVVLVT